MSEQLWFSQTVEGLFIRGLGPELTPPIRARLAELGLVLDKLEVAYPAPLVAAACQETARMAFPTLTRAEGLRRLGTAFMRGYQQTLIGSAMVQLMKVIGTRRALERMGRNFRTGGNYLESRFTSLGDREAEVWVNDVSGMPEFFGGMVEEGGRLTGAANIKVTLRDGAEAPAATLHVVW